MVGPDMQMDLIGDTWTNPANPLPAKCLHCTFPDLDFVAEPYLLAKGFESPAETSNAQVGNFLVRDRVKRIFEVAVPGACNFYKTADRRGKKESTWWLAVPTQVIETPMPKTEPPYCSKCGEPKERNGAMKDSWDAMIGFDSGGVDVFKSKLLYSSGTVEDQVRACNEWRRGLNEPPLPWSHWKSTEPPHAERWTRLMMNRDLYFSIRLEQLLKRAKVKGQLIRFGDLNGQKTSTDDEQWIAEKLRMLEKDGLVGGSSSNNAVDVRGWFHNYLREHARKKAKEIDFAEIEKEEGIALPADYKEFIKVVGSKRFTKVMDIPGTVVRVLGPEDLDFKGYRRGQVEFLEGEDAEVDGVMFGETEHGDAFVFDVSAKGPDYPVYWHQHEENTMELFASTFAECVKRFVERS